MSIKRIGLLTSGGDAPGMNAAIRSVVRTASYKGIEVYGIKRGWNGLINNDMELLNNRTVGNIICRGGTILYTARSKEFMTIEGRKKAYQTCLDKELDAIIAIGGDGTVRACYEFSSEFDIPVMCIPSSIDNNVGGNNYCIGYDTAANTAVEAIDKIRDTMQSHERCSVIEVMGNTSGRLALYVGIATGATSVIVPEEEWTFEKDIKEKIENFQNAGFTHFLIVVSEGAKKDKTSDDSVGKQIVNLIKKEMKLDPKLTVLGYIQRGGNPNVRDRVTATKMGYHAVMNLINGESNNVIISKAGVIDKISLKESISKIVLLSPEERKILKAMTGKSK